MIGYYPACELFELCDQEQLIYLFGCSKTLLETIDWMTRNIVYGKISIYICQNYQLITFSIKQNFDAEYGLIGACYGGHLHLVNSMIEKGAIRWNEGLEGACQSGYPHLVNFMIEKGATDFNSGLASACRGGHLRLVNLMIEKGATDWNWGLRSACYCGHLHLANLMIEKGAIHCSNCGKSASEHHNI